MGCSFETKQGIKITNAFEEIHLDKIKYGQIKGVNFAVHY